MRRIAIDEEGLVHGLTFSTYKRIPVFEHAACAQVFLASLTQARRRLAFKLVAFVVMPDHVHLIVQPSKGCRIASILKTIKQPSSTRILEYLRKSEFLLASQLVAPTLQGPEPRLWQRGGGFDEILDGQAELDAMIGYIHMNPVKKGLCNNLFEWPYSSILGYHPDLGDPPVPIDLLN